MKAADLDALLRGITCTKPFTVADARELHALIAAQCDGVIDVYTTRGDKVYIRVQDDGPVIERTIDVV